MQNTNIDIVMFSY